MSTRDQVPEFAVVVRGYDRPQVDEYVARLRDHAADADRRAVAAERGWRAAADRAAAAVSVPVAVPSATPTAAAPVLVAADRIPPLPTRVEQILVLATEEADELRARARADADDLRRSAAAEVDAAERIRIELLHAIAGLQRARERLVKELEAAHIQLGAVVAGARGDRAHRISSSASTPAHAGHQADDDAGIVVDLRAPAPLAAPVPALAALR